MIIDTHVHIGKGLGFDMPEEMILQSMEKYRINYSIVSNVEGVEYDHNLVELPSDFQVTQKKVFENTLSFARKYPDKIGVMPWIKPHTETVDEDFLRLMEENKTLIHGIKLHSYHSKVAMDDERVKPYIELARKYDIPMTCHTGGCEEADPIHVYNAAKQNPDVRFVMVHMGLGTDNQKAIDLMVQAENLYADTTWVPMESAIKVIKLYGSKRIVFGSDNPIDGVDTYYCNPKGERSIYQDYFQKLEGIIGKEAYDDLMYRNAMKIFNL
ncbi:amidohydrolase family protein [Anaerosporobacter sp.]